MAPLTTAHVIAYAFPTSAVDGPLSCGTAGVVQTVCWLTATIAVPDAPPMAWGNAAVIVADPTETPLTLNSMLRAPDGMTAEEGTVAIEGFDELSVDGVGDHDDARGRGTIYIHAARSCGGEGVGT